ncbi:MAG: transposase [Sulfuriflexus sp.]|nr:transposase [Sulfuriflexus sp.]
MKYRRVFNSGTSYFFTVVTTKRLPLFNNEKAVQLFSDAMRHVMLSHPFTQDAFVIMPDHIHCVWSLPKGDTDYSMRWGLIKAWFKEHAKSRGLSEECWESNYWEHCLSDDRDYQSHLEYIHYNPVKHGLSESAGAWPHSSFRQYVALGLYQHNWGSGKLFLPDTIGSE